MMADIAGRAQPNSLKALGSQSGTVAILLCTLNGARFLPLQLASYEAQDFSDWLLFASDDGSQDDTLALLEDFRRKHGASRVQIRQGPGKGFVANFLSLLCDPAIEADYYAPSDQDDVWDSDKLTHARLSLIGASSAEPVVYCSRTRLIDESGLKIRSSLHYRKPPHFRNALAQSLASGNTMVLNEAARRLLMRAGAEVTVPSHDWWIYLAVTAVGGQMLYDNLPRVSYRIHARNVIGSNSSMVAQIRRAAMVWRGRYSSWAEMNVGALERIEDAMTEQNRKTFNLFRWARKRSLVPRSYGLIRSGVYRQTLLGNIGLATAMLAGKL